MDFKNIFNLIQESIPPIHKEGYVFIFIFIMATAVLWALSDVLGFFGLIATAWCTYFFRDPERVVPIGDNFIVSPADGVVSMIEKVSPPAELGLDDEEVTRVTVFLNIFNVHVNRIPVSGEVTVLNYHPGKFLSANLDKASAENERQSVVIKTKEGGHNVICVQIAGVIARRIVCYLEDKQQVQGGERYGLIRFGSRCDIYLPAGVNAKVAVGQTAVGGETILADLKTSDLKTKASGRKSEAKG